MLPEKEMTAEAFLAFAEQHPDKRFDFVDGELVEVSLECLGRHLPHHLAADRYNITPI
jgi:Uma2 family endonuclease